MISEDGTHVCVKGRPPIAIANSGETPVFLRSTVILLELVFVSTQMTSSEGHRGRIRCRLCHSVQSAKLQFWSRVLL